MQISFMNKHNLSFLHKDIQLLSKSRQNVTQDNKEDNYSAHQIQQYQMIAS